MTGRIGLVLVGLVRLAGLVRTVLADPALAGACAWRHGSDDGPDGSAGRVVAGCGRPASWAGWVA